MAWNLEDRSFVPSSVAFAVLMRFLHSGPCYCGSVVPVTVYSKYNRLPFSSRIWRCSQCVSLAPLLCGRTRLLPGTLAIGAPAILPGALRSALDQRYAVGGTPDAAPEPRQILHSQLPVLFPVQHQRSQCGIACDVRRQRCCKDALSVDAAMA